MFCDKGVFCPGTDFPIANFSAEAPDEILFFSEVFGDTPPLLNSTFTATGCVGVCTSNVSQDAADQCAKSQAFVCANDKQDNPDNPTVVFRNTPQSCTVYCPDGLPFVYTVPAGLYVGTSQTAVDQEAYQFACQQAALFRVCLGNLPGCTCVNKAYSATIHASSIEPVTWSLTGGVLPPGLTFVNGKVSGTPTTSGTYQFTVLAQTQFGTYMRKTYQITVLEVVTTQLPAFSVGVPYHYQLQATGGSGNYMWKIDQGSLPPGLVLSNTGLISGTPV